MTTRRGRGEGSITKRSDGRWMAQADLGWQDGKRRRKALYGRTKREVQEKLREALHRKEHGLPAVPEQETVGVFLRRWLEVKQSRVRRRTNQRYAHVVRAHLLPSLARIRLSKLTPQDVAACLRHVEAEGSAFMARGAREVLRAALNQALRWELVSRNVAALTDAPRHRTRQIEPLTPDQANTLLDAVAGHRLEALITVAVGLGLRQGEALGLRWQEDIDLDGGVLAVRQTLERAGTNPIFGEPKTTRSRRTITIPAVVGAALRRHRTRQLEERLAAGGRWRESGLVFTTSIGTPLDKGRVHKEFKKILRSAELPDIRYHDLRHTAATLLLAQGVDPRTIMETLGHSQIGLTLNTYAHVMPALQRAAAAKMDAVLTPGGRRG
ncbi:MAG: site-specific integrase [Acidobacteria bacterium]|nr:site-specific integrase [Acidobacteriota bacterium]